MDIANFHRSVSNQMINEILINCNLACFSDGEGKPDLKCVENCVQKNSQLLTHFNRVLKNEYPRIKEVLRR